MEQDIIERKPTSPIATSLLVIGAVCLTAAMVFQFLELRELKGTSDTPILNASKISKFGKASEYSKLVAQVKGIDLKEEDPDDDADSDPDTDPDGDGGGSDDGDDGGSDDGDDGGD